MRSRQQIKDEFRMRMTRFRPAENNPLKFSADVDDALHNLLVKRNPAYLGPVEAFEEAFADLRNHQIAMLAGMRVAFESMLAEFDPDRLQQEFDDRPEQGPVAGEASLLGSLSGTASRDRQRPGGELPPVVRRGVRAGVRRAAQAAQGPGATRRTRTNPAATASRITDRRAALKRADTSPSQRDGVAFDPFKRLPTFADRSRARGYSSQAPASVDESASFVIDCVANGTLAST